MTTFGQRLKMLREEKGMSQQDMIENLKTREIFISKSTYSKWESNTHEPGYFIIKILRNYFKVDADYLLGITDKIRKEE